MLDVAKYQQALCGSSIPLNKFVRSNPIDESHLDPQSHMYRELFTHAEINKLI